ncbi:MAG: alpha/beta hydrolase fold domain-containing protein [Limosilactobacillus sp.]|uniref:alpha/beta hydrolase n=1 Tax=Limosilactobacillus sp. TaxID=2773925 RepID=UPI002A7542D7|nr:alpha/beta hydrolase [Limosilactobacillus sp.]MDY2802896.1 alpha/beta hydrolase [Limosilactobacillus sp.]
MERLKRFRSGLASKLVNNLGNSFRELHRCGDHRSNKATFIEMGIQLSGFKHALSEPAAFDELIQTARQTNGERYDLPQVTFNVKLRQLKHYRIPVYVLNERGLNQRVIVYLAGGAYIQPADKTHWQYLNHLAQATGARVYIPIYSLAPQHNFRAAYQEIAQLYGDLYQQAPASDITLMGDSAGAGLALGFSEYLGQRGLPQPGHLILISPWLDLDLNNPVIKRYEQDDVTLSRYGLRRIADLWAGDTSHQDYRLSPLNGNLDQLRDVHVYAGTKEIMYPDAALLVEKLKASRIPVHFTVGRGLFHIYPLYPVPEADVVMKQVVKVVNS